MLQVTNAEAFALPPFDTLSAVRGRLSLPLPATGMVVGGSVKLSEAPPGGVF